MAYKNPLDLANSIIEQKQPQYQPSDLTNINVRKSRKFHDFDKDRDVEEFLVDYIPYQDKDKADAQRLYGVIRDYKGEPIWTKGAIVNVSPEISEDDFNRQIQLGIQGSDRYVGRGKYDKEWFDMLNDPRYNWDEETKKEYAEKYGWDYNKPWEEHDFIINDPYKEFLKGAK